MKSKSRFTKSVYFPESGMKLIEKGFKLWKKEEAGEKKSMNQFIVDAVLSYCEGYLDADQPEERTQ